MNSVKSGEESGRVVGGHLVGRGNQQGLLEVSAHQLDKLKLPTQSDFMRSINLITTADKSPSVTQTMDCAHPILSPITSPSKLRLWHPEQESSPNISMHNNHKSSTHDELWTDVLESAAAAACKY